MSFVLGILSALFGRWIDGVLACVKTEAAAVYVAGVGKAREAVIALLSIAFLLLLALTGFVFIHIALYAWLPWSLAVRTLVMLALGLVYFIGGLSGILWLTSDRAWMKFTKVDRILASLPPRE